MNARRLAAGALALGIAAQSIHGSAQERPDPAALLAAQRDAMATFAFIDGVWRGPATIRYNATVKDGVWHEIGERVADGQPPVQFFEMKLTRVGDSDWPGAGAVAPK